jgi:hypothetical protein
MINATELRMGNYILQKVAAKISVVPCSFLHFNLLEKGGAADLYPVVLKPEIFEKCGFKENKDYPLLPQAREFKLVLPVNGSGANEILGYVKNNGECFGRAVANGTPISNNFFNLHALQNLYFALTGTELNVKL